MGECILHCPVASPQVNSNGETLHTEIQGVLKMRTHLSGMPELKLGLNDKLLLESLGKRMPTPLPRPAPTTAPNPS